jgi:hypothetical protein
MAKTNFIWPPTAAAAAFSSHSFGGHQKEHENMRGRCGDADINL